MNASFLQKIKKRCLQQTRHTHLRKNPTHNSLAAPYYHPQHHPSPDQSSANKPLPPLRFTPTTQFSTNHCLLGKTSYQARSEFDGIVKDWITTNWIQTTPKVNKACIFLIDSALVQGDTFNIVWNLIKLRLPSTYVRTLDVNEFRAAWEERIRREDVKDLEMGMVINDAFSHLLTAEMKELLYSLKGKALMDRLSKLGTKRSINQSMLDKVSNLTNLCKQNVVAYVSDWQCKVMTSKGVRVNKGKYKARRFDYKPIWGDKVSEYKNVDKLRKLVNDGSNVIWITSGRETSLDYFRLWKLFKKVHPELKVKGCVVLLDTKDKKSKEIDMEREISIGNAVKEQYCVVDGFNGVYNILEQL